MLVTMMTDPDWVPLMKKASAIVTDSGGRTCHAAIVAREYGIPAVVGVRQATQVLKTGQRIRLDGTHGKIVSNVEEVRARGGQVIAISTDGDDQLSRLATATFTIPETLDLLTPILTVIPLQLFSYYVAVRRGCNVDQPRNLAKSVTVE